MPEMRLHNQGEAAGLRIGNLLSELEKSSELLFFNNPLPMWVYDSITLRFVEVNETAVHQYGYTRREFLAMTIKDIRPAEDVPKLLEHLQIPPSALEPSKDWRHRRKDGSVIYVEIFSRPLTYGGRPCRLVVAHDTTARREAERKVEARTSYLNALIQNNPLAIVAVDDKGRIKLCNPAFERLFQYTAEEVLGANVDQLIATGELQSEATRFTEQAVGGDVTTCKTQRRRRDGTLVDVELHVFPLVVGGRTIGGFGLYEDITASKLAEDMLRAKTEQLETIAKAMGAFLAKGNWREASAHLLRGALNQTGSEYGFAGAVVDGPVLRILAHEGLVWHKHQNRELFEGALKTYEQVGYLEFTNLNNLFGRVITNGNAVLSNSPSTDTRSGGLPIGHPPLNSFLGVPILLGTEVVGMIGVANRPRGYSVAEQHKLEVLAQTAAVLYDSYRRLQRETLLEDQLRQSQKMEAIGRLAGGIAHDFNNLMGVIIGYGELLAERLGREHPSYKLVSEIYQAGEKAASLTKQLLAFSRQQVLETKVLDLGSVVNGASGMLRRLIGEDIELATKIGPSGSRIKADPGQVEQVVMNLAVNARDAMPTGGKLTIEVSDIELDEQFARQHPPTEPGPYVMLVVRDTGVGMDKQTQVRIFEPFFTTKEEGKGTGLGLATTYGIVKQSGGYIWVESEIGKGTTFRVYLPRVEEYREPGGSFLESHPPPGGSETILVVEDQEGVREITRDYLETKGYRVFAAESPRRAIQLYEGLGEPIQLLLTDVVMPGMSGRELARHIIGRFPGVKVLYMSGYTNDAVLRRGVQSEGVPFLNKPFNLSTLARKVREVLDSKHQPAQ